MKTTVLAAACVLVGCGCGASSQVVPTAGDAGSSRAPEPTLETVSRSDAGALPVLAPDSGTEVGLPHEDARHIDHLARASEL